MRVPQRCAKRHDSVETTGILRQRENWRRHATREVATGRAANAIASDDEHGHVDAADTREQARADLIERRPDSAAATA